jgi:hypothetical protein
MLSLKLEVSAALVQALKFDANGEVVDIAQCDFGPGELGRAIAKLRRAWWYGDVTVVRVDGRAFPRRVPMARRLPGAWRGLNGNPL